MEKIIYIVSLVNLVSLFPLCCSQPGFAALLGLSGFGDISESQVSGSGSCPYQAHLDRTKFSQVVNNRLMTQDCAPGTMFVLSKCSCDNIPSGGPGGGPMPGSNPRLQQSSMRGGSNPMLESMMNQFSGGSPMMSNLGMMIPQVTSGIRPDQPPPGIALNVEKARSSSDRGIQYNPDPGSTGLTSVVDPSILPNVLPPEILNILQRGNSSPQKSPPTPRPRSSTGEKSTSGSAPSWGSGQADPALIPPISSSTGSEPSNTQNLPPEVLQMLERAMRPPTPRDGAPSSRSSANKRQNPSQTHQTVQTTVQPSPRRKLPTAESNPVNDVMAQLSQARGTLPTVDPRSGPREDPLAALLAGLRAPSNMPNHGQSRGANRNPPQRIPSHSQSRGMQMTNSGGGDPLAALMAGLTRGSGSGSGGSDRMAALLGSAGGSMGGSQFGGGSPLGGVGDISSMLAGLGGGSRSTSGGPFDVNSLNVATLLGNAPGPALAQSTDMTSLFNDQGRLGIGGGLAGLNNLNIARLQELDRQGVIDLSDLTPAGLAAANAHFG